MIQIMTVHKVLKFENSLEAIEFQRELSHMLMCLGGFGEENRKKYPFVMRVEKIMRAKE